MLIIRGGQEQWCQSSNVIHPVVTADLLILVSGAYCTWGS